MHRWIDEFYEQKMIKELEQNYLLSMSKHHLRNSGAQQTYQYSDWICIMCQNLNYSFRKTCNRCKSQTRTHNDYLLDQYELEAKKALSQFENPEEEVFQQELPVCEAERRIPQNHSPQSEASSCGERQFPKLLFIELSSEDEDESESNSAAEAQDHSYRWINFLIE